VPFNIDPLPTTGITPGVTAAHVAGHYAQNAAINTVATYGTPLLVLNPGEAVPAGTPDGTVILRRETAVTTKIATFRDNFAAADTTKWIFPAEASVAGGQLILTPTPEYPVVRTVQTYDLRDSACYLNWPELPNMAGGTVIPEFNLHADAGTYLHYNIDGNPGLYASYWSGGADLGGKWVGGWALSDLRWLRIREAAGTVYWDRSADGATWVNHHSPFDVSKVYLALKVGFWGTDTAPGRLVTDNVNGG
jgi:hypothetical protein